MFQLLANVLNAYIDERPNVLGFSDSPYGPRKIVLKKLNNVKTPVNNKILFGSIYDFVLKQPIITNKMVFDIYAALHTIEELTEISTNKEDIWEIKQEHFVRIHPDIYTNLFIVENKTTAMYADTFQENKNDLKVNQVMQLNGYLGYYKQDIGFLHECNQRGFLNPLTQESDEQTYLAKMWDSYGKFIPIRFDKELYEDTVKTLIYLFDCIDNKRTNIRCPSFSWECAYCDVSRMCNNPITSMKLDHIVQCYDCGKKLQKEKKKTKEDYPMVFIRNENYYCKEQKCEQAVLDAWEG